MTSRDDFEPMAHPRPDPSLPPDDWRDDVRAAGLAMAVILVIAFLASVLPGAPAR